MSRVDSPLGLVNDVDLRETLGACADVLAQNGRSGSRMSLQASDNRGASTSARVRDYQSIV